MFSESKIYEYLAGAFYNVVLHIEDQMPRKNELNINILIAFKCQGYIKLIFLRHLILNM